jgi:hypothetical protein
MKITFAGTPIASESPEGGTDAVAGFVPKGSQVVQWIEPLRAPDATPIARGNRKQTLTGTIWLAQTDTLAEAMLLRGLIFTQLPRSGPLVFVVQGSALTYANAVLTSFDSIANAKGVAVAYQLTFSVGPGQQTQLAIATEGGLGFATENGKQIIS